MSALTLRPQRLVLAVAALALAGCGSVDRVSRNLADAITPYKVEIVQGNFVSREQVELLKAGMSRAQVRELLGTPLVTSVFHADRWDYVFTLRRQGVAPQDHRLTLFFKGDAVDRFEGTAMPSESEFVAILERRSKSDAPPPVLQASEEQLKAFAAARPQAAASAAAAAPAPVPAATAYPPLESVPR